MNKSTITELPLDSIGKDVPALTKNKAAALKESCIWCLCTCEHTSGVQLISTIQNESYQFRVVWNEDETDLEGIYRAYNDDDAIEFGAEGLSILLVKEQTAFTAIERAAKKTGIDYWLGYQNDDPLFLFTEKSARLEISGILRESDSNTVKRRIKLKSKQTEPTDHTFPVYISIVEFFEPKAEIVRKDVVH